MKRPTLAQLGVMLRERRGGRKLRDVAKEIGIGAATLMRVENGRVPDLATFGKICKWLDVDPRPFLGVQVKAETAKPAPILNVSAHFRADRTPEPKTVNALATMLLYAAETRRGSQELPDDGVS